ncbi:RNA polymerase sigma factor SigY [Anaerobacillus alkalidiazotrophicus]|uniref:RNA polymerase sigma factor SigY n=1 Tax=Anaerobacillus alkalidiazotrophicus TaxID=472963 RepID=A0A1S2M4N3_9BACI|nr:RNA polymerase sigma factor SigY [Anaerobacillus alkalidiazotrophicus]OIJ19423.1 RNA polymerase sigma factor SigY [Anaerobacillus alkalidiazotrophicus]
MEHEDDVVIIQKAMTGDDDAFAHLFQRYFSFLYKYLLKLTLDEEVSRDLAQETMLKCYTNLASFNGDGKFSTWMVSIATRLYIDLIRKKKRERKWIEQLKRTLSRQLSWQADMKGMEWSDVFTDFNQLDADVRVPILLHHYYGYTYDEIGVMIGIKTGTVKSRVHNGLKQIRKEWDDEKKR